MHCFRIWCTYWQNHSHYSTLCYFCSV